jgi:hypothetical protein
VTQQLYTPPIVSLALEPFARRFQLVDEDAEPRVEFDIRHRPNVDEPLDHTGPKFRVRCRRLDAHALHLIRSQVRLRRHRIVLVGERPHVT